MKTHKDASLMRMTHDNSDDRPYAMLGAGRLTCALWKRGDEHSGWQYSFNIFAMNRDNGHVSQMFEPDDVADLAKLTRLMAFTLADDGCLSGELRDDLYCLASCLDQVLPSHFRIRPVTRGGPAGEALYQVIRYLWDDEARHFAQNPSNDHIYRFLVVLENWKMGVGAVNGSPLADLEAIRSCRLAGCPICGKNNGHFRLNGERWSVCHAHRLRWLGKHSRVSGWDLAGRAIGDRKDLGGYIIVEPIHPADESQASD